MIFDEATTRVIALIRENRPDVVISLGQAEGRTDISLEQIAVNLDDAKIADNSGNRRENSPILADGPATYLSTLPITELETILKAANIKASISDSAGTFVCNHVFYSVQHHLSKSDVISGFIHVPLMREQSLEFPNQPYLELEEMIRALKVILDYVSS